jgi:hypothetical protein
MSTESTTPAVMEISASERSTAKINDFSDRLPPMLVKELRQGLRARTFVGVFLGLQLFLGIVMLFATAASGMATAGDAVSRIIFLFFSLAVLVVQPLRAMNSLHAEIKSTTIDMMVLTRLNARRIVAGKWASIVGQTLLLFISILPYLILRYFFGGMNLFGEMLALASIFIASACLTAFNVGRSSNSAIIVRGILPLVAAVYMAVFTVVMMDDFDDFLEFFAFKDAETVGIFLACLLGSVYLAWTTFGLGVTAIAPAAENHSSLNRVITLATMLLSGVILFFTTSDEEVIPLVMGIVAIPGVILGLTESNFLLSRVTQPFIRRGAAGKLCGLFLYPCWVSGVHFAALLTAISLGVMAIFTWLRTNYLGEDEFTVMSSIAGSLLLPGLIIHLFEKKISNRLGIYIATLIASYCLMLSLIAVAESTNAEPMVWIFAWLPPVQLYMADESSFNGGAVMITSLITTFGYLGVLLIKAWSGYGAVRAAEKEAEEWDRATHDTASGS